MGYWVNSRTKCTLIVRNVILRSTKDITTGALTICLRYSNKIIVASNVYESELIMAVNGFVFKLSENKF